MCNHFIIRLAGSKSAVVENTGEVHEWLKWHAWKACVPLKGTPGSNPGLSAEKKEAQPNGWASFLLRSFAKRTTSQDSTFLLFLPEIPKLQMLHTEYILFYYLGLKPFPEVYRYTLSQLNNLSDPRFWYQWH